MALDLVRREKIAELARSFEDLKSFRDSHPSDYQYARKKGFAGEVFSHLRRIRVVQRDYGGGRHCTKCLKHQPIENFLPVSSGSTRRRAMCLECHNAAGREWRSRNKERAREIVRDSAKRNPHLAREMKRRIRARTPEVMAARDMLKRVLKLIGKRKRTRTEAALGYTAIELRAHLEAQFGDGMSWKNWGDWHIDHIKPISVMVAEGITDPAVINALSNLRPLWSEENLTRSRREWWIDGCDYPAAAETGSGIQQAERCLPV